MRSKIRVSFGIIKRWCHSSRNGPSVGILGVPFDKGQSKKGVGNGPAAIRNLGLIQRLEEIGKIKKNYIIQFTEYSYFFNSQGF